MFVTRCARARRNGINSPSCQEPANSVQERGFLLKMVEIIFIVYYFVTGRYFDFLSARAFNIFRDNEYDV